MMTPRGIAVGVGMIIVGRLADRMDLRILVLSGMTCTLSAAVWMSNYTLEIDPAALIWPGLVQGFGMALIMVPLSVYAYTTLPRTYMAEAAGMSNVIRNLGSSIGISLTATMFSRYTQQNWQQLGGYINPLSPNVQAYLRNLHLDPNSALGVTVLGMEVGKQAAIAAMSKVFLGIAALTALLMPFVFALRTPKRVPGTAATQVSLE
jgi:MFS transporter, DHA2 family, multidrug resistance protein